MFVGSGIHGVGVLCFVFRVCGGCFICLLVGGLYLGTIVYACLVA